MKFVLAIFAVAALTSSTMATVYDRCSLARAMSRLGVPRADLYKWACIAQHESSFNTAAVGPTNSNGSHDYGIFQINDVYWCQPPSGKFSYNECRIGCDGLLTNDIEPSVKCALKVKSQQGFTAWSTWRYCDGHLASIDDCF